MTSKISTIGLMYKETAERGVFEVLWYGQYCGLVMDNYDNTWEAIRKSRAGSYSLGYFQSKNDVAFHLLNLLTTEPKDRT